MIVQYNEKKWNDNILQLMTDSTVEFWRVLSVNDLTYMAPNTEATVKCLEEMGFTPLTIGEYKTFFNTIPGVKKSYVYINKDVVYTNHNIVPESITVHVCDNLNETINLMNIVNDMPGITNVAAKIAMVASLYNTLITNKLDLSKTPPKCPNLD